MKAKSIKGKSPEEIKTALQESMADGFKPTLAIVFVTFKVIDAVISACKEVKETTAYIPDAMLLFSCAARLIALGPLVSEEIQGLKEVWEVPMAGFFTYGKFGRSPGNRHEFHNTTCCWVALKEK